MTTLCTIPRSGARDGEGLRAREGTRALHLWRSAIETGARAHQRYRAMSAGPEKRQARRDLTAFHERRRRASAQISTEISRHEGSTLDFEQLAGTLGMVTNPSFASQATTAASPDLGFLWFVWIPVGLVSAIVGYAGYRSLTRTFTDWSNTFIKLGFLGGGLYLGYLLLRSKDAPAAASRPRYVGEEY